MPPASADDPSMAAKTAAVDFARVASALNLPQTTLQSLSAFRARNAAAKASLSALKSQKQDIDFAHYRAVLKKNTQIVDRLEKVWNDFKPSEYDVSAQIKAIEAFESKAVSSATEASQKIEEELAALNATLQNIEGARPFDQLTLSDIDKAEPRIAKTVETMVKKGKWTVEGYTEKFGNLSVM
ncbi:hypothetical protein PCANC_23215 [Puccinia coronata f. sp. avenae]|uniref:ATP synthase subunit d, mitochondrial n=2 Tax=Puccinia coronata f. sp. avenae TaxID=200324 RepID=A0A2N5TQT0_9BASI|nr:hypothetical protein PCANC_23215 [Puccinia coronata f. sp. avenae]PLW27853.1 hypothetical protein PCASD_18757 [Puccinia coronata f. sp. avenae]